MRIGSRARIALLAGAITPLLAGCGGGGGVSSTPTPPTASDPPQTSPDPPATPTPPAAPTPSVPTTPTIVTGGPNDTQEYRNSTGAQQANAIVAYNNGATGAGITAAILDTGIDLSNPEFNGRISSASASTAGNGTVKDEGGHGTAVAGVLAAARNDSSVLGIAYGATILAVRTDTPGSCAASSGCKHDDTALARGVDLAVSQRARVINISLGGEPPNAALQSALSRATAAGIVVVISAGNEGTAQPDDLALIANNSSVAKGLIIIAGAVDTAGAIASFSNQAGSASSHYLTALGVRVRSFDETGAQFLYSGTSFSAPLISGAVALLAQAFPNLTGAQIVSLLYSSADDVGTAGVDAVYGNGRLNLVKAFAPRGATSLAGSAVPVSLTDNGTTSAAMGDAVGQSGQAAGVILDGYGRAYAMNFAATLRAAAAPPRLAAALANTGRNVSMSAGNTVLAVSLAPTPRGYELSRLSLDRIDASVARATAGLVASRLGRTDVAFGFGQSGGGLGARLAGEPGLPFLVANGTTETGFDARQGLAFAARRAFGNVALTVTAEQGEARLPLTVAGDARRQWRGFGYDRVAIRADRRFGPLQLGVTASRLREESTVLGARLGSLFGPGGATTDLVDLSGALDGPFGWRLAGTVRRGWTRTDAGGAALTGGRLTSSAYAVDLARAGLFSQGDRFALRIAQPLRVARGGYTLWLPTAYDYATGEVTRTPTRLDLAPRGRELDMEAAWGLPLGPGWLTSNLYWRRDPGNVATLAADLGAALRYGFNF